MNQSPCVQETDFASAERASMDKVFQDRKHFLSDALRAVMLDTIPDPAVVLNKERQIVAGNRALVNILDLADDHPILSLRPGEAVACVHAWERPGGCGTSRFCMQCGAVRSILHTQMSRHPSSEECRISIHKDIDGGMLEFQAHASLLEINELDFVLLVMRDISAEKRRKVLEKTLFYNVRCAIQNLYGLSQIVLNDPDNIELREFVSRSTQHLLREISLELELHSLLLSAERGDIQVRTGVLSTTDLLLDICEGLKDIAEAQEIQIQVTGSSPPVIETDLSLIRIILREIMKNALDSTRRGETVSLGACQEGEDVVFTVHNPGVIPDSVKDHIFMRSFSTKEERGRGIGTFSAKLFTERYLNGRISYTSSAEDGTAFTVRIPHRCESSDAIIPTKLRR